MLGSGQTEKCETGEEQSHKHVVIFYDIKIVHKEFDLAGQTVNSAYCCGTLRLLRENVRRLRPEIWQQDWLLHHSNSPCHSSFFSI
jgi:hypothetical protein